MHTHTVYYYVQYEWKYVCIRMYVTYVGMPFCVQLYNTVHVCMYESSHLSCTYIHTWYVMPTLPVIPAQLMRPGIGHNTSTNYIALCDCLTSGPEGCSWLWELWFMIYSYVHMYYTDITYKHMLYTYTYNVYSRTTPSLINLHTYSSLLVTVQAEV